MKNVVFGLFLLYFVCLGESVLKIWKYDYDILNPEHWVGGKAGQQCDGLDLRDASHTNLVVDQLDVKQVFLPPYTRIFLPEGTSIKFHEEGTKEMDCVRIKDNFNPYSWLDPFSWTTDGAESNVAVPHFERIPCHHDDIAFPKGWKSSSCLVDYLLLDNSIRLKIHSFKFGDNYITNANFGDLYHSIIGLFSNSIHWYVEVDGKTCEDPTGCVCGNAIQDEVCLYVKKPRWYDCLNPILPVGFCSKMCGASILVKNTNSSEFSRNFEIERVRKALGGYSSDTHVSKVHNGSDTLIQIVFAEKDFTGNSLDDAKDFYNVLLTDNSFGVADAVLLSSGLRLVEGKIGKTAVSIVFGCLCGVLLVFGTIFFVSSPRFARLNLTNRYHFTPRPLSSLLAKYEKMDDERLSFQKAESVLSLEKSFDNPMYDSSAPSTSSASTVEEKTVKSEMGLENPMYEIKGLSKDTADETFTEENQLVDLTPSKEPLEQ